MATSLVLSILAWLVFAGLWVVDCPAWLERFGVPCDVLIGVSYFAVVPGLALLGVIFSARDAFRKGQRVQAVAAFCLAVGLLGWLWKYPPH